MPDHIDSMSIKLKKLFQTLLTSCQNTCRVYHIYVYPVSFCSEAVFLPQLFPVLQLSNSSECCVFRVSTVRPIETDCCCCCCCWHPRVWCYCWDDFRCNWNLDISGVGGCRMIEICLTVPLFVQAYLIRQDIELCLTCAVALFMQAH